MYDLIIIGAGPAGITAGLYAGRQRIKTLLLSKSIGGQIARKTVAIENYPGFKQISGLELIEKFTEQLRGNSEVEVKEESVRKIEKVADYFLVETVNKNSFQARTVIITSGVDPRPLEVPGEKEFIGRGISYCTACDGPFFKDKVVAVIGGGNSGFEAALFLTSWAKKIYILEYSSEIKAEQEIQERARKTGLIEVITLAELKEIQGKDFVQGIVYEDKRRKENVSLAVEGVFIEIGSQPATSFVKELVEFNEKDEIVIDLETMATKTAGLFAAGDVTNVLFKQIVVAAGEGAKAAFSVFKYLFKNG